MPSDNQVFTFQTRARMDRSKDQLLTQMAELLSSIERHLFKELSTGKASSDLKSAYIRKYQITARHFNAIRIQLEGKIASAREKQSALISLLEEKIASIKKRIAKLTSPHKIHQKKRLLFNLEGKLKKVQLAVETKSIALCFGSKQLYRKQFNLEAHGYHNHEEWLQEWQFTRNNSFFLLGSKDEACGNQSCSATVDEKGELTLRIRLPNALAHGKYLLLPKIRFAYGHASILQAIASGVALSYRLKRDEKGWRIFATLSLPAAPLVTSSANGVIGVDINADHLAIAESDRFGNPLAKKTIPLNTYGKTHHRTKALIGDVCASIITLAKAQGKTLVIENLNFAKKKAHLKEESSPKKSRMLSSLAYNSIKGHLKAKGHREGVEVKEVNPAFTSLIGRMKFAKRYGLSIHQAAALVIGRRFLKVSERVPRHLEHIPDGKGGYVALPVPVRNRGKHVWSSWRILHKRLQTVLAAHFRTQRSSSAKSTCETETLPKFTGATPVRESVDTTARLTCFNKSFCSFA